jgi:23S rRNA pseudouridine1911/1915/1917 synthase
MAEPPTAPRTVTAATADAGQRLDRLLATHMDGLSRSRIQGLIRQGAVRLGGRTIGDPGHRVKPGDAIIVTLPEPDPAAPLAEPMRLAIAYEDRHLIVIDKPAGLVVHPAAGHASGTLVNALIAHCGDSLSGIGGVRRPGIVHRLDKDTSGLLVVAKTDTAHRGLAEQFAAHGRDGRLHRRYRALVWGVPTPRIGHISAPLARSAANRTKIAVAKVGGREAITHYAVEETFADAGGRSAASLVALTLETGRTHQIRVHMAHAGHPLLGDASYGAGFKASARRLHEGAQAALAALGRQALHAAELGFEHPVTRRRLRFESGMPVDLAALLAALQSGPANARRKARRP